MAVDPPENPPQPSVPAPSPSASPALQPTIPPALSSFQTGQFPFPNEALQQLNVPPQQLLDFLEKYEEINRGIRSQKLEKEENREKRQEWTKRWAMGFAFGTAIAILVYAGLTNNKDFPEKALIASISAFGGFAAGSLKKQSDD